MHAMVIFRGEAQLFERGGANFLHSFALQGSRW